MSFAPTPSLSQKRILVIEDNVENLRLFRAILQLENALISEAERAEKGIEIARREQPHVILMDMQMPGMDGLTATRLLRADPLTCHIPIIVITASAMHEDRLRAAEAGCSGYISKPVDPVSLARQIANFINASAVNATASPLSTSEPASTLEH
ncbi:two-component system, cell cycle response regulator DivK [Abditibacterium utsteinense]|uniref:Two-component system, cell cycle response regulator DivK n=1 Tax=Abditibacterium utsteinense TaxID=1960156 RepID=A0A2S8SSH6_9BACT|nr:response regulator [Abditibacterium utsteinense]PQV63763.1 two-component system, cell cycle response regulator DivK [Abditibacterium utsteinense]